MGVIRSWFMIILLILMLFISSIILMIGLSISSKIDAIGSLLGVETYNYFDAILPFIKTFSTILIVVVVMLVLFKEMREIIRRESPLDEGE